MTTELLDSTVSTLNQDNSSVEYIDSHENSIATVQTDVKNLTSANSLFDFNAVHNGEAWTRYRQYEETIRVTNTETKNA